MNRLALAVVTGCVAFGTTAGAAAAAQLNESGSGGVVADAPCPPGSTSTQFCSTATGPITGTPIAIGTFTAFSTTDFATGTGVGTSDECHPITSDVTLSGPSGTITKRDDMTVCGDFSQPLATRVLNATGTYTISGGTGAFMGATGSGTASFSQTGPVITSYSEVGTISVPSHLPTTADDCKHDGWQQYGVFKNQGDCVSFIATKGKNPPSGP